jgi:CBS domain-containing protein
MFVRDVMTETVAFVGVDTTIHEAAELMRDFGVGFLPVIHEGVCAGVLTDRDIVTRVVAEHLDPHETTVAMVLSSGLFKIADRDVAGNAGITSISEDATVDEALERMDEFNIHHLAVYDEDLSMIGVISRRDIRRPLHAVY